MSLIYEVYHSKRNVQTRIIEDDDFTYQNILHFLKKYRIKNQVMLDIGCGVGTIDFYLAKKGAKVTGIDVSKNGIDTANKNLANLGMQKKLKFKVANFPKSYPKSKFDKIICSEVLEHLKNDKLAVKTIFKILNKSGIVIASSPSKNAPLYRMGALKTFDRKVGHLRRYSENDFVDLFKKEGFVILETNKTEGILRNFLFTNPFGGFLLRILNKKPFSRVVTFIDNLSVPLFGESDIYIVAQKR